MGNEPEEPMTALIEAATGLHEWYISLLAGGFTTDEALTIISKTIAQPSGDGN